MEQDGDGWIGVLKERAKGEKEGGERDQARSDATGEGDGEDEGV